MLFEELNKTSLEPIGPREDINTMMLICGVSSVYRRIQAVLSGAALCILPSSVVAQENRSAIASVRIGLGTRDSSAEPWHIEGINVGGEVDIWRFVSLAASVYVAPLIYRSGRLDWQQPEGLDYGRSYIEIDRFTIDSNIGLGPWISLDSLDMGARPAVVLGGELKRTLFFYSGNEDEYLPLSGVTDGNCFALPQFGVSVELMYGGRMGLSVRFMDRIWMYTRHNVCVDIMCNDSWVQVIEHIPTGYIEVRLGL